MKKNMDEGHGSRTKIQNVFDEEQEVSQNFKLTNFYTNHRFNLLELKNRLEQFKKNHHQVLPPPQPQKIEHYSYQSKGSEGSGSHPSTTKNGAFSNSQAPIDKQKITLPTAHRNRLTVYNEKPQKNREVFHRTVCPQYDTQIDKKRQELHNNYRIKRQVKRYENKLRTASGNRQQYIIQPKSHQSHYERGDSRVSKHNRPLDASKLSKNSDKRSLAASESWALEGKIYVSQKAQLIELQKFIDILWGHYQLLTKVLLGIKEGTKHEKNAIVKYVEDVCSDRFEFVREYLNLITRSGAQKNQFNFVKRLKRSIVLSRLFENMAIIYVGLTICLHRQAESLLVNFVGYCCSNITFMIRFIFLLHSFDSDLRLSAPIAHIMNVIGEFEQESYKENITRISDIVLRMEHNNEIISIVQGRLCNSMDKDFQKIIVAFLKSVDLNSKPFYEYSHYIYQFLAYQLAKKDIIGQFSFLQMAPSPYLESLPMQKTLVIEPWEVLLSLKGATTYIRAYCDTLLREVGKHWNIVYWTDLMPDVIDPLIDKLPPGKVLYRYHCRYENDRYLKLLWRLGTDNDNTIIIDRDEANFRYDKDIGIALPWHGRRKDTKLLELLGQLHNFLIDDETPLRKIFPLIKQQIQGKKKDMNGRRLSDHREQESFLPKAMTKPRQASRGGHYDD